MADQVFNVNCGFFNSVNGDRKYNAEDMIRPYKNIISNGVFATPQGTPSNKLQVLSADDGMNIIVKAGDGIFADKWFESPADLLIEVPANPNIVARRDSVIVQIDKTQQGRVGNIVYRTGIAASDPIPPTINESENIIEYRIANIYVAPSVTEIGQDVITDLRGSEECLWVTSLIQQVDTSELYRQWQAAYQKYYDEETAMFNDFMSRLTEQLTVYTSLITYESHYTTSEDDTTEIPINIPTFDKDKDVLMVKINHLGCSGLNDYSVSDDSSKIVLTKPLLKDQSVDFLVLKSVVVGDAETVLEEVQKLASTLSSINNDITELKNKGNIVNSKEIEDKEKDTYAANIIDTIINENNDIINDESYVDIKNQIVSTGVISDLEVYQAYVKKRNGFTSLKMILKTSKGWTTGNVADAITIPKEYATPVPLVSFCRMNNSYSYPLWNGSEEKLGFLYMGTNSICIRTSHSGMKVVVIDLVY